MVCPLRTRIIRVFITHGRGFNVIADDSKGNRIEELGDHERFGIGKTATAIGAPVRMKANAEV